MIPHFLSDSEVIVAVSPDCKIFVVGQTFKHFDASAIHKVVRLRWCDEQRCFFRSRERSLVGGCKVGAFFPPDFFEDELGAWKDWLEVRVDAPQLTFERRYAVAYTGALKQLCALASKAVGADDRLCTIEVHAEGYSARTHGAAAYSTSAPLDCASVPRDGLGTVVVSVDELKRLIKEEGAGRKQIAVERTATGPHLRVGDLSIWTVNRTPFDAPVYGDALRFPIAEAARRALPFVCADKARPNLTQLRVEPREGGVYIYASDGCVMHRESVDCAPPPRAFHLPLDTIKKIGKRDTSLSVSFAEGSIRMRLGDVEASVSASTNTFPPCGQVIADAKLADPVRLREADAATLRKALASEDADGVYLKPGVAGVEVSASPFDDPRCGPSFVERDLKWCDVNVPTPAVGELRIVQKKPGAFERVGFFDAERLAAALSAVQGPFTLALSRDVDGPLILIGESQTHLLMPFRTSST